MYLTLSNLLLALGLVSRLVEAAAGDKCHNSKLNKNGVCKNVSNCATGFTTVGDCPNDPTDVRCCIENYQCSENNMSGTCLDKNNALCTGKGFFAGYCPGDKGVQCCFKRDDTDNIVAYLKNVYNVALAYGKSNTNQLVMEWLRHKSYNDFRWKYVLGNIDGDWIDFAKAKGLTLMTEFADPAYCGQRIETDHWGAAMNAIYKYPPPGSPSINLGDFLTWGGDLLTFWVEYWVSDESDAYKFCLDRLGKATKDTSFKLLDFLEDVDGYNIAMELRRNRAKTIYDAVREYYAPGGGYKLRFSSFYLSRFAGDGNQGKIITRSMLVGGGDPVVTAARPLLVLSKGAGHLEPVPVPGSILVKAEELDGFINGFVAVLRDLTSDVGISCSS